MLEETEILYHVKNQGVAIVFEREIGEFFQHLLPGIGSKCWKKCRLK
jgi:hypothetical protein